MDTKDTDKDTHHPHQPPAMSSTADGPDAALRHVSEAQPFPRDTGPSVRYVAEGMANMVFSFPGGGVRDLLLRVPKRATGSYSDIHGHWCRYIYPLFRPADLVPQYLVALDDGGAGGADSNGDLVRSAVRTELDRVEGEGGRPLKFRGSKLKEDIREVMLIRDMRPRDDAEKLIEFKPKWLAQSPTAPAGARRCRNCAREALRSRKKDEFVGSILCPLRLLDRGSPESLRIVCDDLTAAAGADAGVFAEGSRGLESLREWLLTNELLPRLRDAQLANDTVGVLEPEDTFGLGRAMTLRDCTCYVRLTPGGGGGGGVEARLGDLDLKDQETKLEYWKNMELELIDGGWYMGAEVPRVKTNCLLEA
ncbi:hypothetical protein GGTG_10016 [Gaeumannomyces tritici R3-111a-1]|uniref:Inositol-pentakisphosphate 2-kinase n=1 Tax=Gaeumannomyces tritici (strain R3-111a-1) TaxID=644352 RepID=J3P932_GAET3|nr:hypothetical protein GGTG_10016 [Gaeumannomyces tritici R3-111a-1]EJT73167.1 hypothetical protein GGTG_10016 [Gaeumannomyces tritici R3-111a-1]